MEPYFSKHDKAMFYKYINAAHVYFEYGSGGSTYQASLRENIGKMYSVESDREWQEKVKQTIKGTHITFLFNEMDTRPNTWGDPGVNSTMAQRINYSNQLGMLTKEEQTAIDFVLIDGRFRVACCLKAFSLLRPECFVAFDDFLTRPQYAIVLDYFDIVDQTSDKSMVILRKKLHVSVPDHLLQKYEGIRD